MLKVWAESATHCDERSLGAKAGFRIDLRPVSDGHRPTGAGEEIKSTITIKSKSKRSDRLHGTRLQLATSTR
jgi:hypothetical protein